MRDQFGANVGMGLFSVIGLIRKADASLVDIGDIRGRIGSVGSYPTAEKST